VNKENWVKENEWERRWWGDCVNTHDEERKQLKYASFMGLDQFKQVIPNRNQGFEFDLKGKSVLDIGGGPTSLLLKCTNFNKAVVIDPGNFPAWIKKRYETHNVELKIEFAEEICLEEFDEVWIYNVLQHVVDPDEILRKAKKIGKIIRIFEWLNTGISDGHPFSLTKEWLDKYFSGTVKNMNNEEGLYGDAYIAVHNVKENKNVVRSKQKVFHLLGLAHLPTNKDEAVACAFSQKVLKMGKMLKDSGHKVYFYGVEGSTVECDEFIPVSTKNILLKTYGNYDWKKFQYKHDSKDFAYTMFNNKAIQEINKRKQNTDYLLITFGWGQKAVADAVNIGLTVESGIGYPSTFAKFKVFESYAFMHYSYGKTAVEDGLFYDCVIPNYFDPADFTYSAEKKDYFLYLGRLIKRKGVDIAKEVVSAVGGKLIIAGQRREGVPVDHIDTDAPYIEYAGFADLEKRRILLSEAKALFVPTTYIGPFEGVSIEAGFSGTPVITTDWGCFAENVIHGVTGYRCRTLEQFIWAAMNIDKIKSHNCREFAMKNFTLERVAKMYDEYFDMLMTLYDKGWYQPNPGRTNLDWLNREYI